MIVLPYPFVVNWVPMPPGKSVLIIDDCRNHGFFVERAFSQLKQGISVFQLYSGEDAIEHLQQCPERRPLPQLVLLDRDMPGGMDGFTTLLAIRRLAQIHAVPVLMICGSDDPDHIEQARRAGADGYAVKPEEQSAYLEFARQIHAWRPENSWRSSGGGASGLSLVVREVAVTPLPPTPMNAHALTPPAAAPLTADPSVFMQVVDFFFQKTRAMMDPVQLHIADLCRLHTIPEAHARGRGQDTVTVQNRNNVIKGMMDHGYSDRVILDNFFISQRQVERLRADWKKKDGGPLTDRPL